MPLCPVCQSTGKAVQGFRSPAARPKPTMLDFASAIQQMLEIGRKSTCPLDGADIAPAVEPVVRTAEEQARTVTAANAALDEALDGPSGSKESTVPVDESDDEEMDMDRCVPQRSASICLTPSVIFVDAQQQRWSISEPVRVRAGTALVTTKALTVRVATKLRVRSKQRLRQTR